MDCVMFNINLIIKIEAVFYLSLKTYRNVKFPGQLWNTVYPKDRRKGGKVQGGI